MKNLIKITVSIAFVFTIGVSTTAETENKVEAQPGQLVITEMNYEEWAADRTEQGYPVDMTKSEWIEKGYHQ